jgi:hypothetical protein
MHRVKATWGTEEGDYLQVKDAPAETKPDIALMLTFLCLELREEKFLFASHPQSILFCDGSSRKQMQLHMIAFRKE